MMNMNAYDTRSSYFGSSRFATEKEFIDQLQAVDMTDAHITASGLPLMSDGRTAYLCSDEDHNFIMGQTGSGKSRRLSLPMLLTIAKAGKNSVVVTDVKGELYRYTSGLFSANGYKVLVINLRDPKHSHGWSLLHRAAELTKQGQQDCSTELLADFATVMHPDGGKSTKIDPFWSQTSRQLTMGVTGLICEYPEAFPEFDLWTLQQLVDTLDDDSYDSTTALDLAKQLPIDSVARNSLINTVLGSDKTLCNILVSYAAGMSKLYTSKPLTQMLSTPDITDFSCIGRGKTILYIILPDEKTTLHGIASLIINQCYTDMIQYACSCKNERLPVHVDFLLDEFSNLPAIPDMAAKISASRSRNISFSIIVQGLNQLESKYGATDAATIMGNCTNWIFLTSREYALLDQLSKLCGINYRTNQPLISTSQLQRLDQTTGEALVLCRRLYPYVTHLADLSAYSCDLPPTTEFPTLPPHIAREVDLSYAEQYLKRLRSQAKTTNSSHPVVSPHATNSEKENDEFDLQKVLEERFDKLFGDNKRKSS